MRSRSGGYSEAAWVGAGDAGVSLPGGQALETPEN